MSLPPSRFSVSSALDVGFDVDVRLSLYCDDRPCRQVRGCASAGSAGAQAVGAQRTHSDVSSDLALLALRPSHGCDTRLCEGNIESHCLSMSSDSSLELRFILAVALAYSRYMQLPV